MSKILKWLAISVMAMCVVMVCLMIQKANNIRTVAAIIKDSVVKTIDYKSYEPTKRYYWSDAKGEYYKDEDRDKIIMFKAAGQKHWVNICN